MSKLHTSTKTMKAIVATSFSKTSDKASEVLEVVDRPMPVLAPNQVLIQVHGVSVNLVDLYFVAGKLQLVGKKVVPFVVGIDLSGVITEVGSAVKRLVVGDRVIGNNFDNVQQQGAYAQYIALPEVQVTKAPKQVSLLVEAAAIPGVGLTALQALTRHVGTVNIKGSKILILGASGGVGCYAIPIARALGAAEVYATCSSKNIELVKSLGATKVIPYDQQSWASELRGKHIDYILDAVGGQATWVDAQTVLRTGGTFVTIVGDAKVNPATGILDFAAVFHMIRKVAYRKAMSFSPFGNKITYNQIFTDSASEQSRQELDQLVEWIDAGAVKPVIERVYEFDEIKQMWDDHSKGRSKGKLVAKFLVGGRDQ